MLKLKCPFTNDIDVIYIVYIEYFTGLLPESYTERTAESDAWTLHKNIALNQIAQEKKQPTKMVDIGSENLPKYPGNIYENVWQVRESDTKKEAENKSRRLFLMRHGERVDFTFGTWVPYCFDENGTYIRKDLNMPETIPKRAQGPSGYLKDTPLTNVGVFQATQVGEGLKSKNMDIAYAYSSPALRSIQTCDGFLRGCNKRDSVKIRIEPCLFEWTQWYQSNIPGFMTNEELIAAGYNIDDTYEPIVKESDLIQLDESCEKYYQRNSFLAKSILSAHPTGNIILVGHSSTLDVCSRELLGKKPRTASEMTKIIQKIPYCGLIQLGQGDDEKWEILELPFPPITHSNNNRFDYRIIMT